MASRVMVWLLAALLWAAGNLAWAQSSAAQPGAKQLALPANTIHLDKQTQRMPIDRLSEYWVDAAGNSSVEQIDLQYTRGGFAPRADGQKHSIHNKALWIRFSTLTADRNAHWFLEVALPTVHEVSLYKLGSNGQWTQQLAGNTVARNHWPVPSRNPLFELNTSLANAQANVYYLRVVQRHTAFSAPLRIYQGTALVAHREGQLLLMGVYFGLAFLVALGSVALAIKIRDTSLYTYGAYIVCMALLQFNNMGLAGQYLWPDSAWWAQTSTRVLATITAAASLWFVRTVMRPALFSQLLDTLAVWIVFALLGMAALLVVMPQDWMTSLVHVLIVCDLMLVFTVVALAWRTGGQAQRWIALGMLPVCVGVIAPILRNFGLIPTSFLTQYGVPLGSSIGMPILMYALIMRTLARRVSLARAAGMPKYDALTGLANMRHLLAQIQGAMTRAMRFNQHYALVLVELSNHHWFQMEHGTEVANRALVLLGTRLQKVARDVDTAARIEKNQFVLLIEGPCKASLVVKMAAHIASGALLPTDLLPVGAKLNVRISCALMPTLQSQTLGDDANAQLGWVIDSAEALPDDPRKPVRTLNF